MSAGEQIFVLGVRTGNQTQRKNKRRNLTLNWYLSAHSELVY